MLVTKENELKIVKKFKKFMDEHDILYEEDARNYILDYFMPSIYDNCAPDILLEIMEELGLTHVNGDFYQEHLDRIKNDFGLSRNITEIGGGWIPSFAEKIAKEQIKMSKGTITVYDPQLIIDTPKYANMTLIKDKFNLDSDVSKSDLLIGILPCEATKSIIESAANNNIDFYIAMCGCVHSSNPFINNPFYYQKEITSYASRLCNESNLGDLVVDYLPNNFDLRYPILKNKRK